MKPALNHFITFLPCLDLEAQDRFYQRALGLSLRLDQGVCRIYSMGPGVSLGFCTTLKTLTPSDQVILTLVSSEVQAWHDDLVRQGVAVDGPPRVNERFQILHFFAADPMGYRIEIQEFLDPRWNQ